MYNYRQQVVYFILWSAIIVLLFIFYFILTGGPGSGKSDVVANL